jgi:transcriptional regulator with XRE-family HTH domain
MLTLEQIRAGLADRKAKVVAAETGLTYMTVWRIANGKEGNPKFATLKVLSDYLTRKVGS